MHVIELAETGLVPDFLVRIGIRHLLGRRLHTDGPTGSVDPADVVRRFADELRGGPLAIATDVANAQHYEVPAEFFELVLGPRLKYSSCFYADPAVTLAEAEDHMLRQTCERAGIQDGQKILELGCGWGSLTLWIAEHFPNCQITAVSNSVSQREFIERRAARLGHAGVRVITADMREFETDETFDRVVSVEMFEHMRNYELLFGKVAGWLHPQGQAFVHVFCHRETPYQFETEGAANWMGRHFFTGGIMPSERLFAEFSDDLTIEQQWRVNGLHYWRTCEAWLKNLDQNRATLLRRLARDMPEREARRNLQRWRMFFMACAELFRFRGGDEWFVAHYLFGRTDVQPNSREGTRVEQSEDLAVTPTV